MRRILRFVHCTLKEKRCFIATNLDEIFTWVDASYAVRHGINSQNEGVMSMGLVVSSCISSKQNLNTNNSTESYLIGSCDYVPYNI